MHVSQQSPKMLKMALEIFTHALLLFLGLFLKSFRWVPLNYRLSLNSFIEEYIKTSRELRKSNLIKPIIL